MQGIAESRCGHERGSRTLPFEQCVGRYGRAHPDGIDLVRRNRRCIVEAEHAPDAFDCSVVVVLRIFREQLRCRERAVGSPGNHIGEGATAIDPEFPSHR